MNEPAHAETAGRPGKDADDAMLAGLYAEVFRAAPDGILIVSHEGEVRFANPQAAELFCYDPDELVGLPLEALIPEPLRKRHRSHVRSYTNSPSRRPMNAGLELFALRRDGTLLPVEISLSPGRLNGVDVVIAMVRDVTEATRMRAFGAGTLKAAENERRRIAQELHDDTAQRLAAVKLNIKRAQTHASDEHQHIYDELRREVGDIAKSVSIIARGLMPPELERMGVVESVRSWLAHRVGDGQPTATLRADPVDAFLDAEQRLVLYRIVQEAVSNAVRHAGASSLTVSIKDVDGVVETRVEDDGAGFDVAGKRQELRGLGLMGMRERAAMVGALISISSRPGEGTTVRVAMNKGR